MTRNLKGKTGICFLSNPDKPDSVRYVDIPKHGIAEVRFILKQHLPAIKNLKKTKTHSKRKIAAAMLPHLH
jgi:hypothetical protein